LCKTTIPRHFNSIELVLLKLLHNTHVYKPKTT